MNYVIWPEVNGFWAHAAAKHNKQDVFDFEFFNLAKKAVRDGNFMEIYNPITGQPYGGLSDYPESTKHKPHKGSKYYMWQVCKRQTWCATAYFRMITMGIFGMTFTKDGITFSPHLPKGLRKARLKNLKYVNMKLNIKIEGRGVKIKEITRNGSRLSGNFLPNTLRGIQDISIITE